MGFGEAALSLNELSAAELCAGLTAKNFSAVDLADELIRHIEEHRGLGGVAAFDPDNYRRQAEASDARRKDGSSASLDGIPLILKDNIDTQDLPTTGGTRALTGKIPSKVAFPNPNLLVIESDCACLCGVTRTSYLHTININFVCAACVGTGEMMPCVVGKYLSRRCYVLVI